jgi:hypothetical protein
MALGSPSLILALLALCGSAHGLAVRATPFARAPVAAARRAPVARLQGQEDDPVLDRSAPIPVSSAPAPQPAAPPGLSPCTIKVIGVGGGGGNTINRMVQEGPGVERSTFLEYIACNTDIQARHPPPAHRCARLQGGEDCEGMSAGGCSPGSRARAALAAARPLTLARRRPPSEQPPLHPLLPSSPF